MVGFQAVGDVFGALGNRAVNAPAPAAANQTEQIKEAIALGNQALASLDQPLAGDKGERSEILLAAVVALAGVVLNDRKWLSEPLGEDSAEREEITISPLGTKQDTTTRSGLPFTTPIPTPTTSGFPTSEPTSTVGESFVPTSVGGGDGGGDGGGGGDPLVFDLNDDGKTDATATQHGINVDGLTDTKWAAKGDGVLVFGNEVVGTDNKKYQDAYATLEAHAKAAGIDTSKGYLDAADIKKLEASSDQLGMLVSNGDGTNKRMSLSELGITRLDLGHNVQQVNNVDAAGNRISAEGSFVRNGQVERVSDLWLRQVAARA
jgi:hypothetical protein